MSWPRASVTSLCLGFPICKMGPALLSPIPLGVGSAACWGAWRPGRALEERALPLSLLSTLVSQV